MGTFRCLGNLVCFATFFSPFTSSVCASHPYRCKGRVAEKSFLRGIFYCLSSISLIFFDLLGLNV